MIRSWKGVVVMWGGLHEAVATVYTGAFGQCGAVT